MDWQVIWRAKCPKVVAGVGFELYDLHVMSPTMLYRAALHPAIGSEKVAIGLGVARGFLPLKQEIRGSYEQDS